MVLPQNLNEITFSRILRWQNLLSTTQWSFIIDLLKKLWHKVLQNGKFYKTEYPDRHTSQ